ncbi:MAG: vancomycin high temperature exclusion protein [Saprospiraceae bacterium]
MKQKLLKLFKMAIIAVLIPIGIILLANVIIELGTRKKTYINTSKIPKNKVGLVLGTAKHLNNGNINLYFKYRIAATVKLYKAEKINFVLVSGDNSRTEYDEPTDFKNELIKNGIPENKIFLDYAGFRTLDSVVRAKKIFGQNKFTVISQEFHNERAIFLAARNDIEAVGFNAQDVTSRYGIKVKIREYFSRTKVFIDILLGIQPKFLGETIEIK